MLARSPTGLAESLCSPGKGHFRYGLFIRFRLLSTPSAESAVTFDYGDVTNSPAGTLTQLFNRLHRRTSTDSTDPRLMAAELVQGRPDVMAALAGVHAASANAHLANAARTPDLQLGPILDKNANGTYDVGVRVQRDLFVFNNGRPLTRQRNAEWQQQNRVYTQLKTRAAREAETAIDRYERARALAKRTKVDLSPFGEKMPDDLKDINAQFQAGQADVLIVYATQNSLLQDRRTYLDSLNELALSATAVVQATAVPVERIVTLADDQHSL